MQLLVSKLYCEVLPAEIYIYIFDSPIEIVLIHFISGKTSSVRNVSQRALSQF